jgi:ribonuclease-3
VAEHLYAKFPDKDEGFLTQMRSKIVNRDALKQIALKMGIGNVVIARISKDNHKSFYGDHLWQLTGLYPTRIQYGQNFILKKVLLTT